MHYSDSTTGQALSGERAGLIHSLIGDTRDNLTDPHRGVFWSVGTELALQTLGSDVDYAKLYGQLYHYLPLGPHVVWAQGYRVGVTPGDDPLLLLEGRFHAGGASSVRGFEENTLGPQTGDGESLGGQAVAIFNQELRFPIVKKLWGGIFYDAGNVFALTSDLALGASTRRRRWSAVHDAVRAGASGARLGAGSQGRRKPLAMGVQPRTRVLSLPWPRLQSGSLSGPAFFYVVGCSSDRRAATIASVRAVRTRHPADPPHSEPWSRREPPSAH